MCVANLEKLVQHPQSLSPPTDQHPNVPVSARFSGIHAKFYISNPELEALQMPNLKQQRQTRYVGV